ncbi:MAG TPA: amidohydrolase family protein [Chthoniobacteraceae bacterium]|nr:amidohydrolase family protein [Chthoniobacteraceae bacterium]
MSNTYPIVDCDVHQNNPTIEQLVGYLDEPYRSELSRYGFRRLASGIRGEEGGNRRDLDAKSFGDPHYFRSALLDRYGHRFALLSGTQAPIAGIPDPDYVDAICRGLNRFYIDHWLPVDERFHLGLKVPLQDPAAAVREIERLAGTPQVAAVCFFGAANRIAFGNRYYWPIYEACERHGLPIHIHPATGATITNAAMTPAGEATTYLESHVCLPQFYMAQAASMVLNGVFEKFPGLRVMLVEGGIAWLPHLLWRMDAEFKALRQQAPFLKRMPSQYVRDHIRLTTQPIEEPAKAEHLQQIFNMIDADHIVMYASDFPHWDFDEPTKLPRILGETTIRRILHDNAADFFKLPAMAVA